MHFADTTPEHLHFEFKVQHIAGLYGLLEARIVYAQNIDPHLAVIFYLVHEHDAPDLCHCLYLQHARHDGVVREMPHEKRLIDGYVLDALNGFVLKTNDFVHQQKGVSVWQQIHNLMNIKYYVLLFQRLK